MDRRVGSEDGRVDVERERVAVRRGAMLGRWRVEKDVMRLLEVW